MPIQQTKKQSDLEKRLSILRRQIYGREMISSSKYQKNTHTTNSILPTTDITYLRQDLVKISLLSSIALGAQIVFYLIYF